MVEKRDDLFSKQIYSVDASIHEIEPLCIFYPKNVKEVVEVVELAKKSNTPLIARGAGTGLTGGCLGTGYILDLSKYMNKIVHLNVEDRTVTVEPGVVQDKLNAYLMPYGLRLGPDTSTGNRATLGGMLANNAAGAHSLIYGRMVDQVDEVEIVLSNGSVLTLNGSTNGSLLKDLKAIIEKYKTEIEEHFPKTPRRSSGYSLDAMLKTPFNLSKLIAGSEGTLGIVTKIKMKLHPLIEKTTLIVLPFDSLFDALSKTEEILRLSPIALEIIGPQIIEMGRLSPAIEGHLDWLKGNPKALLVIEFSGETPHFPENRISSPSDVWKLRNAGLGLLMSRRTYSRAIAFIEDVAVPPHQVASFMHDFETLLSNKGKEAGIYGHAGAGCIHVRPFIDLRDPKDIALMKEIMDEVVNLTLKYQGVLSGEHGDGLTRSYYNKALFGEKLTEAFCAVKEAFDPLHLMNPGKIVHAETPFQHLRGTPQIKIEPFLDFTKEGGFELAVDMCNGNGECRKKDSIMCPTFQATNDEYLTTRARAQSLRALINGKVPKKSFESKELFNVLDLCIECKGCKRECPSLVDMAKMKSEFLFHYNKIHGITLRTKIFTNIRLYSKFTQLSKLMGRFVGITDKRPLPKPAKKKFSSYISKEIKHESLNQVMLFTDTYTEIYRPDIGLAAIKILEAFNYTIHIPHLPCCGRPQISKGLLKQAKEMAQQLASQLIPYKDMPMITLEPSCHSAMIDDYQGLVQNTLPVETMATFLKKHLADFPKLFKSKPLHIAYHGHCHEKALESTKATLEVLRALPGAIVEEIPSSCCGMAGSFGYEKEHYDLSMQIGEKTLFPHIRKLSSETVVVTNGFSCTAQILHGTKKRPLHLIELLADRLL